MNKTLLGLMVLVGVLASSFTFADEIKTVAQVDLGKYLGNWYQISRNQNPFEPNCYCAVQILAPLSADSVSVRNTCNKDSITGDLAEIKGSASVTDAPANSKLSVDFGFFFKGEYWIIGLDEQYRYAVVTDSKGSSLYILSKTPTLAPELYNKAVLDASSQVNVTKLKTTPQEGCTYPALSGF